MKIDLGALSIDSVPTSGFLVKEEGEIEQLMVKYHVPKVLDRTFTAYVVDVHNH